MPSSPTRRKGAPCATFAAYFLCMGLSIKRMVRMKKVKKGIWVLFAVVIVFLLYRWIFSSDNERDFVLEEEYGSFSPYDVESYDGKYVAKQKVERLGDVRYIRVYVYEKETGELAGDFWVERAWDFWGICWENDSYNIWTQSADVGIYCYRYEDGEWRRDSINMERPEYIVSRWEAKEAAKE